MAIIAEISNHGRAEGTPQDLIDKFVRCFPGHRDIWQSESEDAWNYTVTDPLKSNRKLYFAVQIKSSGKSGEKIVCSTMLTGVYSTQSPEIARLVCSANSTVLAEMAETPYIGINDIDNELEVCRTLKLNERIREQLEKNERASIIMWNWFEKERLSSCSTAAEAENKADLPKEERIEQRYDLKEAAEAEIKVM